MTLLDILVRAAGLPADLLVSVLRKAAEQFPDLAQQIEQLIVKLQEPLGTSSLVALAEALPREIANIAQGRLDPRDHPSDLA